MLMDETTFRDLLARHWTGLFDPRTLERGADYQRRGLVLELRYQDDVGEGVLIGTVQGSAREPYLAGVRLAWDGVRAHLDSYCTCPMQESCKHVAATILHKLRSSAGTAEGALAPPQLGAWKSWLDTLRSDGGEIAAEAAAPGAQSLCAILLRSDGSHPLPALQAQVVRVQPGKRGGYATPQPLQPSWADPVPWRGLDATTFQLVAGLRMRAPAFGGSGGWFRLANNADEPLVETLLASLPCFFDKVSAGRLALGPARALRIGWEARDDGTQKLALSVDGAPSARLLKVGHLWYFDASARELGRVDGDVRLAEAVLRAPPLLPEQVPLLMERWRDTPLLAALPRPAEPVVEKLRATPDAVLSLRVVSAYGAPGRAYQAGVARLAFDYGGMRLPMYPAPARERRRQGERVVEVTRDRAREGAAIEQLEELGLVPAEMRACCAGCSRPRSTTTISCWCRGVARSRAPTSCSRWRRACANSASGSSRARVSRSNCSMRPTAGSSTSTRTPAARGSTCAWASTWPASASTCCRCCSVCWPTRCFRSPRARAKPPMRPGSCRSMRGGACHCRWPSCAR